MAGQRRVDQAAQAVVQAQGFNLTVYCDLALLQAVEQLYAGGNRLGRQLSSSWACCELLAAAKSLASSAKTANGSNIRQLRIRR